MTENELCELWLKYHVPTHIMAHMRRVEAVSMFVGEKINLLGGKVDLKILRQAALLHDLVKICDFAELDLDGFDGFSAEDVQFWTALIRSCHKDGHITAVCNILEDLKEDRLAEIIKKHRFNCLIADDPALRPESIEEKILYYADKRVRHDQITSLAERLEDGRLRYFPDGNIPPEDALIEKALYKLESEICRLAGIAPGEISETTVAQTKIIQPAL